MDPIIEPAAGRLPVDFYRILFDEAAAGILIASKTGQLMDANQNLVEMSLYPREKLLSQPVEALFPPIRPGAAPLPLASLSAGQTWAGERRMLGPAGQLFPVAITLQGLSNGFFLLTARDITGRKLADQAIQESEERYRNLFENTPIPVWEEDFSAVKRLFDQLKRDGVHDLDAYLRQHPEVVRKCADIVLITDVNRASMDLNGAASKEDLLGKLSVLFTPESYGSFQRELVALWAGKTEIKSDSAVQDQYGKLRESAIYVLVSPGHEHTLSRVLVSSIDMTERNKMERALRESEEKFRLIIEQAGEGVCLLDEEGLIIEWNQARERFSGLKRADVIGRPYWDILVQLSDPEKRTEARREAVKSAVIEGLKTGRSYLFDRPIESGFYPANGQAKRYFRQAIFPIKTETGYRIASISTDISERKETEEALHSASLYARSLIEASLDPLVTINPEGKITDANRAAEDATGYSRDLLIGCYFSNYFTDPQKARLGHDLVMVEGLIKDYPLTLRHVSGRTMDVLVNATVYKNAEGAVVGVLADAHDITEIKRIENELARHRDHLEELVTERSRQLQRSEEQYRSLFNRMSEGFEINEIIYDEQGRPVDFRIIDANPAFERLTGLKRTEVIGRRHNEILPEDDPYWLEIYGKVVLNNQPVHFENYSSALKQYYEVFAYPLGSNQYADLFLNITGRKNAEELLRRQSLILTAINRILHETLTCETDTEIATVFMDVSRQITGSRFGFVYEINSEGQLESVMISQESRDDCDQPPEEATFMFKNLEPGSYWGRVFGLGRSQIANHPEADPGYPESPENPSAIRRFLGVPLRDNQVVTGLIGLANKGSDYTLDDQQAIETIMPAFVEALNRKRAQRAIQNLNNELGDRAAALEAVNKELEAFAYSVSHDLRAPLRHIDGFLELLDEHLAGTLDDKSQHYMTTIANAANQMGGLIDDLLFFSRLGRQEMRKSQVDLGALVNEVIEEFEPELRAREVRWRLDHLPQVNGDKDMLRRVLINLIGNALKFTRTREVTEVEIGALGRDEKEVTVFVRDNGIGFDMEYAGKLFGIFQRLHLKDQHEGNGMGLASVRRLIDRHGGRTWAEGKVDQGATIYFTLPRRHARDTGQLPDINRPGTIDNIL